MIGLQRQTINSIINPMTAISKISRVHNLLQSARIKRLKSGGLVGFAKRVHILIKTVPAGIN